MTGQQPPEVSLISPAFDEPENIGPLIQAVDDTLRGDGSSLDLELVLLVNANDPSDTPAQAASAAGDHEWVRAVEREAAPSYGGAVRAGLSSARGEVIVPVMGDLADDLEAIPTFVQAIEEGADVVYASRFIDGGSVTGYPPRKLLANRAFNKVVKLLYGVETGDLSNGFSAYHRRAIDAVGVENLTSESFDIMIERKLKAHFMGFQTTEVPVSWRARETGESRFNVVEQGARYGKLLLSMLAVRLAWGLAGPDRPADPDQAAER
jgi:glycosyltransferase involved in cell wall biosynthesis